MEPPWLRCYTSPMSRQISKERTRRRLLQAILKTIHRYGLGSLTTGRVAELAGVAQPTFYVHFRSMDQALEQVAEWVADELSPGLSPEVPDEGDRASEALQEAVVMCARTLVRDRRMADAFLRNRRDPTSALGRRWTVLLGGLRERMRQIVVLLRSDLSPADAALHADLLIGLVLGLAEAHLDGRLDDLDRGAQVASRAIAQSVLSTTSVADAA